MIPKIIHYCWFGYNSMPEILDKCIKSWKKKCKGYEIIKWDESNFDIESCPLYVRQAYQEKKWAFVSDYARLKIIYENGGIYLDTDVEILKSLDSLCEHKSFFAFEDATALNLVMNTPENPDYYIATGLGFGAEKESDIIKEMMMPYEDIPFILPDGSYDQTTCPRRNTDVLIEHGLQLNNTLQNLDGDIEILPSEYMCPYDFWSGKGEITSETISIHWYSASWMTDEMRKKREHRVQQEKKNQRKEKIKYLPNRILLKIVKEEKYEEIKSKLLKK